MIFEKKNIRKYLRELSAIPEKFYCACVLGNNLQQWSSGKLKGLRGLSTKVEFINQDFLTLQKGEGTLAVFPFNETNQKNDIVAIRYEDPEFLVQNNMQAIKRVAGQPDRGINEVFVEFSFNLANNLGKLGSHPNKRAFEILQSFTNNTTHFVNEIMQGFHIDSVEDLANSVLEIAFDFAVDREEEEQIQSLNVGSITSFLRESIVESVERFKQEQEWLIKNDTFSVPENSVLIVHRTTKDIVIEELPYDTRTVGSISEAKEVAKEVSF